MKKPHWYYDKPSEKQVKVLASQMTLRNQFTIPKTKGGCSDLICELAEEFKRKAQVRAKIAFRDDSFSQSILSDIAMHRKMSGNFPDDSVAADTCGLVIDQAHAWNEDIAGSCTDEEIPI